MPVRIRLRRLGREKTIKKNVFTLFLISLLFLCSAVSLLASGTGSGNATLMVNPIVVNASTIQNMSCNYSWITCLDPPYVRWCSYGSGWNTEGEFESHWESLVDSWPGGSGPNLNWPFHFMVDFGCGWQSQWQLRARYNKGEVVYNLSEAAIGYAPSEIEKAWMLAEVVSENAWGGYTSWKQIGSIVNKTVGGVGTLKTIDDTHKYMVWSSIPISNFGTSAKAFSFEPSLSVEDLSPLKPPWAGRHYYGIDLAEFPKILFIPKAKMSEEMGHSKKDKNRDTEEPINIINGNMYSINRDISIPAKGLPLQFTRTYNSRDDYNAVSGYGWTHSYNVFLEYNEHKELYVRLRNGEGARTFYVKNEDGTYHSPAGEYSVLVKNTDDTYTLTKKHGTKYNFDLNGKLTSIADRNNNTQTLSYTGDLLTQITDSSGKSLAISYNADNRISQVADSEGRTVAYDYDTDGNLTSVTDQDGSITTYSYDEEHNLITIADPEGNGSHFIYDTENDRCLSFSYDNDINKETLSYDPENSKTILTDSKGNSSIYEYNNYGVVTKISDSEGNERSWTWDENINRTSSTDANGNTTLFEYDDMGNLTKIIDPKGHETVFAYEENFDMCASITDTLSQATTYGYDERGNLIQMENANGDATNYIYNLSGNLLSTTDANEHITQYEYGSYGNLVKVIDSLNNETQFEYDTLGNCTKLTDAKGNETEYTYDILSRLTQITYPDNSTIRYAYDKAGNRTSVTDPLNRIANYTYDPANKLLEVIDALQNRTTYGYDTEGNRVSVEDAKGNVTTYVYDSLNRLVKVITPSSKETIYSYDGTGNRVSMTDAKGNTTIYEYDENNRLIKITYADGKQIVFTYDKLGRRTSVTDTTDTITYEYDNLNRIVSVGTGLAPVRYNYDKVGNRTSMTDQDEGVTQYAYDELNRLISLTAPDGKITNYSYDTVSNLTNMSLPNNTQVNYQFDNLNRLLNLTNKKNTGDKISSFGYDYNLSGMRDKVMLADGSYVEYEYDDLNRLTKEAKYNSQGNILYSNTYEFDNVGNRLKLTKLVPGDLEEKVFEDNFNRRKLGENWQIKDGKWRIAGRRWLFGWARNKGEVLYNSEDNIGNFEAEVDLNRIFLRYKRAQLVGISYQGAETRKIAGVKGELKRYCEKKKVKRTVIIWKWKKVKFWRWTRLVRYPVKKTYWRWVYHWRIEREVSYVLGHYEGEELVEDTVFTEETKKHVFSKQVKVKVEDGKAELYAKENGNWVKKVEFAYPATEEGKVGLFVHGKRVAYSRFDNFKLAYQVGTLPQEDIINYAYNNENQLLTVDNGQGQALSLQYDDNGNLIRKDDSQGATDYSWDTDNRLVGMDYPDGTSDSYVYDGVGKRIQTSEDGNVTNYLYDGLNCIIEQDNSGLTKASYVRGLGYGGGIGSVISANGNYYYYDGIGNVVNTADSSGSVTQKFVYDAYGNILNGAVPSPHGFSTKEYSNKSGLIYFGARYYDPMTGRWISKDPLTWGPDDPRILGNRVNLSDLVRSKVFLQRGIINSEFLESSNINSLHKYIILQSGSMSPQLLHRYMYCFNNPVNYIDPRGFCIRKIVKKILEAVAAAIKGGFYFDPDDPMNERIRDAAERIQEDQPQPHNHLREMLEQLQNLEEQLRRGIFPF